MTPSLIATAMLRDPLYHIECLTAPSYTKYLISSAPMRGSQRSALQCLDDDAFDLAIADFAGHPRTRLVEQPVEAALDKAPSPMPAPSCAAACSLPGCRRPPPTIRSWRPDDPFASPPPMTHPVSRIITGISGSPH